MNEFDTLPDRALNLESGDMTNAEDAFEIQSEASLEIRDREVREYGTSLSDGTTIRWVSWGEIRKGQALVLIHHGLGEHALRHQNNAAAFFQFPCNIVGYDARGHGRSGGTQGDAENIDHLVDDLMQMIDFLKAEAMPPKILLMGHSLGGLTLGRYLSAYDIDPLIKASILSAPAFAVPMDIAAKATKVFGKLIVRLMPEFRINSKIVAGKGISSVPAELKRYQDDPDNHQYLSARLGLSVIQSGEECITLAKKVSCPTTIYHSRRDPICAFKGSESFVHELQKVTPKNVLFEVFDEGLHELHHETPRVQYRVKAILEEAYLRFSK